MSLRHVGTSIEISNFQRCAILDIVLRCGCYEKKKAGVMVQLTFSHRRHLIQTLKKS
jgi:hypothetical protein